MASLFESLSPKEIETVKRSLDAAVNGSFFPDWEFETLIGVDRDTVRNVFQAWPRQTVGQDEFTCAVVGAMNGLVGYPHDKEDELVAYVPGGRIVIEDTLRQLTSLRL